MVQYILLSLSAGTLTDRINKKRPRLLSDPATAICTLSILFAWFAGNLELWHVYLVNCITGTAQTLQQSASENRTNSIFNSNDYFLKEPISPMILFLL